MPRFTHLFPEVSMADTPTGAASQLTIEIGPHPSAEEAIVSHPVARVQSGGTLDWDCAYGPWVVLFQPYDSGPFTDGDRGRRPGDDRTRTLAEHDTWPNLRYKYTVAFFHAKEGRVYVTDPEVIVDPTGRR
jgi:hypothetical protein